MKINKSIDISLHNSAIIAGIALLLMAIIAPVANFAIIQGLIVPGDAAKTVSNIAASDTLFRIGICLFLIVVILDIVVAWALYIFLKPVNRSLSSLAALLRIVYASILGFTLIYLVNVLQLLSGKGYLALFETNQLYAQVMLSLDTFTLGWDIGLIIFGFHLSVLGYLLFKAGYMKHILGILILLTSAGYLTDGFGKLLSSHYNLQIAMFTFIGELVLIFWLLIKGRKIKEAE